MHPAMGRARRNESRKNERARASDNEDAEPTSLAEADTLALQIAKKDPGPTAQTLKITLANELSMSCRVLLKVLPLAPVTLRRRALERIERVALAGASGKGVVEQACRLYAS